MLLLLTRKFELIVNGQTLHQRVSSFSIGGEFLLVSTFENLLYSIPLEQLNDFIKKKGAAISSLFNDGTNFIFNIFI